MPKHFSYGASSMARIIECPGSVAHLKKCPLPSNKYDKAGTEAHSVTEQIMQGADPFDIDCDEDELDFALGYKEVIDGIVKAVKRETGEEPEVHFEKQYGTTIYVGEGKELCGYKVGGTADAYIFVDGGPLHVVDAKNGYQYVEQKDNAQCSTYSLAIIDELELDVTSIHHHIYQPNSPGKAHRLVKVAEKELDTFRGRVRTAIEEAEGKVPKFKAGPHCEYCNKCLCPVFKAKGDELGLTTAGTKIDLPALAEADVETLLEIEKFGPLVVKRIKDASAILFQRANAGEVIPNRKLVKKFGNREWKEEMSAEKVIKVAKKLGIATAEFYGPPPPALGPAPIEKAIRSQYKGKPGTEQRSKYLEALEDLVEKPETGVKLVHSEAAGQALSVVFDESDDITDQE